MTVRIRWKGRPVRFESPVHPPARTSVLVPWFRSRAGARVFAEGWGERARQFGPEAIAGTLAQLESLAKAEPPSLDRAVIVLARRTEPRLTEFDRERLWQAFRVPVFEQIIGASGRLLATECDAHDGLHVEWTALNADPSVTGRSPCPCGRTTPRLLAARCES